MQLSTPLRKQVLVMVALLVSTLVLSCQYQEPTHPRRTVVSSGSSVAADTSPARVDPLFQFEGQLCAWVRNIFQDSRGDLWFGTNHYGIMRYDGDTLLYFDEDDGVGAGRITEITEDTNGVVWIGTYGGLTKYDGTHFTTIMPQHDSISADIWSVEIDRTGQMWLGTIGGVVQFDGLETFTPFPLPGTSVADTATILDYNRITAILEDQRGHLWFGTDGFGLCRYDGDSFQYFTTKNGLPGNVIYDLLVDREGNLWVGTMYGGISRYDGQTFTNFTQTGQVDGEEAGGLFQDTNGDIWFAAEHNGVYRYDGKAFTHFDEGAKTGGILAIMQDRENRFWMGGWGGLFRFDGASLEVVTRKGPWGVQAAE